MCADQGLSLGQFLAREAAHARIVLRLSKRVSNGPAINEALWSAWYELDVKLRSLAEVVIESGCHPQREVGAVFPPLGVA